MKPNDIIDKTRTLPRTVLRIYLGVLFLHLSGCSLIIDGGPNSDSDTEFYQFDGPGRVVNGVWQAVDGSVADSSVSFDADPTTDAALIADAAIPITDAGPVDASSVDASPIDAAPVIDAGSSVCDVYTDEGCTNQRCKDSNNPQCVDSTGSAAEFDNCTNDSDCETGMGCWSATSVCITYCDAANPCSLLYIGCAQGICVLF